MRVLIAGLGSIGKRHLRNLLTLLPDAEVAGLRRSAQGSPSPAGISRVFYDLATAVEWRPQAALICTPAPLHIEEATALAQAGAHLFIEKPVSDTRAGLDQLIHTVRRRSLVAAVGYQFRSYGPLKAAHQFVHSGQLGRVLYIRATVGQYLPDWRPGTDHRRGVSARSESGGGVLLELSHEIDYVRWIAGEFKEVFARTARLDEVSVDVEDFAELIATTHSGVVGSIHMDMLDRARNRSCRIVGTGGTLEWDLGDQTLKLFHPAAASWDVIFDGHSGGVDAAYMAELEDFFRCVRDGSQPAVTLGDAAQTLDVVLAAKESAATMRLVTL